MFYVWSREKGMFDIYMCQKFYKTFWARNTFNFFIATEFKMVSVQGSVETGHKDMVRDAKWTSSEPGTIWIVNQN